MVQAGEEIQIMSAILKSYPTLRESGVVWLGKVPAHWDVQKLRHVLRRCAERNRPDLPLLSVVREKGVILRNTPGAEENHNFIPDDLSNYKVVRSGQFAMNQDEGMARFVRCVLPPWNRQSCLLCL